MTLTRFFQELASDPPPPRWMDRGGLDMGLNMVRLLCSHKVLAAPAPRLSSPSVQWPLSGGVSGAGHGGGGGMRTAMVGVAVAFAFMAWREFTGFFVQHTGVLDSDRGLETISQQKPHPIPP